MGIFTQREAGQVRVIRMGSTITLGANRKVHIEGRGVPSGMRSAITPRPTTKASSKAAGSPPGCAARSRGGQQG